jgi:hypothetical protein
MKPNPASQNLVLGCGTDYSAEQLTPFASTLRATGYDGQLALVVYEEQLDGLKGFGNQYGVNWISVPRYAPWLPLGIARRLKNRGRMRWLHHFLQATLPWMLRNRRLLGLMEWSCNTSITSRADVIISIIRGFAGTLIPSPMSY